MKIQRYRISRLIPCLLIALLFNGMLMISGCSDETDTTQIENYSEERAREIAEEYVKNSPTFSFDGIGETLVHIESVSLSRCQYCWGVVYEFDSRQAGYGDRTGQMLAQVITPHRVIVVLNRNIIETAIMDEKWDMMKQEMIQEQEPFETICVGELLAEPVYDTEVAVQGKVSLLGQLRCPCFELTSCGETVTVWYDLMVGDDEIERPAVSVAGIENNNTVAVTGELKDTTGDGGNFWASKIEFLY